MMSKKRNLLTWSYCLIASSWCISNTSGFVLPYSYTTIPSPSTATTSPAAAVASAFAVTTATMSMTTTITKTTLLRLFAKDDDESSMSKEELKQKLQDYLKKREEVNADELAKLYVKKLNL